MKLFKTLLASCAIVLGLAACSDDDKNGSLEFEGGDWKVGTESLSLTGTEEKSVTVRSAVLPVATADASWVKLGSMKSLGQNMYSFTIGCEENPGYDPRTATVTVAGGNDKSTISISQWGKEHVEIVSVTPSETLEPQGGSITLKYASTGDVSVTVPTWLTREPSKALTETEVTYVYSANLTGAKREGRIEVTLASNPEMSAAVTVSQEFYDVSLSTATTDAKTIAKAMYAGINIGNTMEVPGGETGWGNPKVNQTYIRGLKAMGFNAVRVPCAWDSHLSDPSKNIVDPAWLDRVDEVIGWIIAEDMYAVLNIHWDGGWIEEQCKKGYDATINQKQHDIWTQIAAKLEKYDAHLLFAGMNEPNVSNDKSVEAICKYEQTFVDAVRATGGNNAMRTLVVQGPSTDINETVKTRYTLPTDPATDRLMVEVHMYDPSNFTIMSNDGDWSTYVLWYWGKYLHPTDTKRNSSHKESDIEKQFAKMKTNYVDKGIPVITGEYACSERAGGLAGIDIELHKQARAYWTEVVTRASKNNGCVPFYWETGGDIKRADGTARAPYVLDALFLGAAAGVYPF